MKLRRRFYNEDAYVGNLGFVEMMKFMKIATSKQKKKMDELLNQEKWREAWDFLKRVTGMALVG